MIDKIVSGAVVIAAIISAAIVDSNGGDPTPYIGLASLGLGYAAGHVVEKARKKNTK